MREDCKTKLTSACQGELCVIGDRKQRTVSLGFIDDCLICIYGWVHALGLLDGARIGFCMFAAVVPRQVPKNHCCNVVKPRLRPLGLRRVA